jgi:hypothetical protein
VTNDLGKWLLKQFNLLATDEMPDLHLRTCQTHKQVPRGAPSVIVGTPMTCDCQALDFWLADLAAKRRIVEKVVPGIDGLWDQIEGEFGVGPSVPCEETALLLRLLALPYARRPGYREEWRP